MSQSYPSIQASLDFWVWFTPTWMSSRISWQWSKQSRATVEKCHRFWLTQAQVMLGSNFRDHVYGKGMKRLKTQVVQVFTIGIWEMLVRLLFLLTHSQTGIQYGACDDPVSHGLASFPKLRAFVAKAFLWPISTGVFLFLRLSPAEYRKTTQGKRSWNRNKQW